MRGLILTVLFGAPLLAQTSGYGEPVKAKSSTPTLVNWKFKPAAETPAQQPSIQLQVTNRITPKVSPPPAPQVKLSPADQSGQCAIPLTHVLPVDTHDMMAAAPLNFSSGELHITQAKPPAPPCDDKKQ